MTKSPAPSKHSARHATLALAVVVLALISIAFFLMSRSSAPAGDPAPAPAEPVAAEPSSLYGALLGRWHRTDGDYLLDIRAVDGAGRAQVDYYNPRPIHVARAEASREGDHPKIVVVLEDVGYPGSYYELAYSPAEKTLSGNYYQATLQETFDVIFTRVP